MEIQVEYLRLSHFLKLSKQPLFMDFPVELAHNGRLNFDAQFFQVRKQRHRFPKFNPIIMTNAIMIRRIKGTAEYGQLLYAPNSTLR